MVTVIASVEVKDGSMEKAKEVLKEIVRKVKESEPGTLEYIPHTVKGSKFKNTILFYEVYKDKEAMNLHMTNLAKNMKEFSPLLSPGMDLKTCYKIT